MSSRVRNPASLRKTRASGKTRNARRASAAAKPSVGPKKTRSAGRSALAIGNDPAPSAPRTLTELMAQALAMEQEAARRYAEFADAMEVHNNPDVAALFRKMADIEQKHARQIMTRMGWGKMPVPAATKPSWDGFEAPETTPGDEVHYLMHPYHVLELALANEQRAERFFAKLVLAATDEGVRKAARKLQAEETEHIALVKAWMDKVPKPDPNWAIDPDPATYTD
jgi:rubrerythrin